MSAGEIAELVLVRLEWAILAYFVLVNGVYLALLLAASVEMRRHLLEMRGENRWRVLQSEVTPRVSMLAPAYNEAATVEENVRAMLGLYYPSLELVVINDGSSDATLDVLIDRFELVAVHPIYRRRVDHADVRGIYRSRAHPNLVVVDKVNGGKADALNAGLNIASGTLVCAVDVDTLIEPDALQRIVRPLIAHDDVVAAGGTIRVVNGSEVRGGRVALVRAPRRAIPGFQVVEYLRAFLFGRLGWNRLGGNLIISGAFGLFRREAVIDSGGYAHHTVGEDMELVLRLRKQGYDEGTAGRVEFIPDPVAWTEAPSTLRVLGRQRDRWHRGLSEALWENRSVLGRGRYGAMGRVVFPYFFIVELLGPVVELIGIVGLIAGLAVGAINVPFAILFFLVAYGLGIVLDAFTLLLDELSFHRYEGMGDRSVLVLWAITENLGYRQLTVVWRLRGLVKRIRGKGGWGVMERKGFASPS